MIPIYIGYDRRETVAFHVLSHSILERASEPVQIIPLNRRNLTKSFHRPRDEKDSTDFSNSRWIVPYLQNYQGWSIFMDCDMLCLADIVELWKQRDDRYAVMVRQHTHVPEEETKFLGTKQFRYGRKNWSSLILFNNAKCRPLTKHIVNTQSPGLWFHQFNWLPDEEIGEIEGDWNLLVGVDEPVPDPKLVHYTVGGPWHGFRDNSYAKAWAAEFNDMVAGDNPVAWGD